MTRKINLGLCLVGVAAVAVAAVSPGCGGDDDARDGRKADWLELSISRAQDGTKCYVLHNTSSGDVALDCEVD